MLFDFKASALDVFLEVAGIAQYDFGGTGSSSNKGLGAALNGGAGIRYYF